MNVADRLLQQPLRGLQDFEDAADCTVECVRELVDHGYADMMEQKNFDHAMRDAVRLAISSTALPMFD